MYIVVKLRLKKWLNHASMKKETDGISEVETIQKTNMIAQETGV